MSRLSFCWARSSLRDSVSKEKLVQRLWMYCPPLHGLQGDHKSRASRITKTICITALESKDSFSFRMFLEASAFIRNVSLWTYPDYWIWVILTLPSLVFYRIMRIGCWKEWKGFLFWNCVWVLDRLSLTKSLPLSFKKIFLTVIYIYIIIQYRYIWCYSQFPCPV